MQEIENENTVQIHPDLREHMDMVLKVDKKTNPMKEPRVSKEDVKKALHKLKNNKAAGPDSIKPELYKALTRNDTCLTSLTLCFNKILETGTIPKEWKNSKTILGAPKYTPAAALRGEIGSSEMTTRIIGGQLQYIKYIEGDQKGDNELLRRVLYERKQFKKDYWIETAKSM
ncbi:hypothetical protein Pmani_004393 [Petrolisthes manimaculis]|uniref:Uncharacterized protein n=1 Tax=Petrolisthes manimaculis TaxID=1843537 RepID=A0AAE1ULL3_9EUCA|nr:hypothetical protein Pmani_004393 [Petrolisthes manimaculis]